MAVVATVSALCEPWVFHHFHKPTLPANIAVGVATKAGIFIECFHNPIRAPRMTKMPSDGGEGPGANRRQPRGMGLTPKSVTFNPRQPTYGYEALSKLHLLHANGFSRASRSWAEWLGLR